MAKKPLDIEYERLRSRERIIVAGCITIFGMVCIMHNIDHAVVAAVAGVLGAVLGRRVWLPKA